MIILVAALLAAARAEFMAEAEAIHRPASQVVREFMRAFVEEQRAQREHDAFLRRKVEVARGSMREKLGQSNEEVEARHAEMLAFGGALAGSKA
jgi:type IV secretory pathway TrbF-like protein